MKDKIETLLDRYKMILQLNKNLYDDKMDSQSIYYLNGKINVLHGIINELGNLLLDECKECEGTGQGKQITFTHSQSINPPEFADCTECNGSGLVEVQ